MISQKFIWLGSCRGCQNVAQEVWNAFKKDLGRFYLLDLILEPPTFRDTPYFGRFLRSENSPKIGGISECRRL